MLALARVLRLATAIAVALVLIGLGLHLAGANGGNSIVSFFYDAGRWLVQPFRNVFTVHGAKAHVAANWGLAAAVYAIGGAVLARFAARAGLAGRRGLATRGRRVRSV